MKNDIIKQAAKFSYRAHFGQFRKYTGRPYIVHPAKVAHLLKSTTSDIICAGWLHDVIEDTDYTEDELIPIFGNDIVSHVLEVTNIAKPDDGNRQKRFQINLDHLKNVSYAGATIKCADIIDNVPSIVKHDPEFAKVYIKEKMQVMDAISSKADLFLLLSAEKVIQTSYDFINRK
jgi:(p)ppGpp synthase/HD superfamily hydrolase